MITRMNITMHDYNTRHGYSIRFRHAYKYNTRHGYSISFRHINYKYKTKSTWQDTHAITRLDTSHETRPNYFQ